MRVFPSAMASAAIIGEIAKTGKTGALSFSVASRVLTRQSLLLVPDP